MSVAGSRFNVKYFDKDNETGLCHCMLLWSTSAQCDDFSVIACKAFIYAIFSKGLAVSHLRGRRQMNRKSDYFLN